MRRVLSVLLLIACTACGQAGAARVGHAPLYTVTTSLMEKPGQNAVACFAIPLPYPPIGCGGPEVAGIDLGSLRGFQRYRNGVTEASTMRLVGTWESGVLTLTEPPQAASSKDVTPTPHCAQTPADPAPDATAEGRKMMSEEDMVKAHGIVLLEFYVCQQALFVVVAVADKATVDFMNSRYAPVKVAGWLQPLG